MDSFDENLQAAFHASRKAYDSYDSKSMNIAEFSGFSISICSLILVSALLLTNESKVGVANKTFSVSDYGVVGNGLTDDSSAFTKAWKDACSSKAGASTISVPQGKKYHLNPINFVGPCKSYINIAVSGKIIAPKDPNAWKGYDPAKWLTFENVNGLNISGPGLFDGYGNAWWNISCKLNPKPTISIANCNGVILQNVRFKNSPQVHVTVDGSSDVYLKFLNISAPEWSPNTDGIHIQASRAVSVQSSTIGTGDDCISIGDRTSNTSVTDIKCGPGHGISIGSLGKDGNEVSVSNINVKNINFHGSTNGARIKTWHGFSIFVCLFILVSTLLLASEIEVSVADKTFSVSDYGAVGNGQTDDSSAFTKAWNDACNAEEGTSTIDVPQGKTYLLNIMEFAGPCKSNINFTVLGEIIAPKDPSAWKEKNQWLIFDSINGLTISGPGSFDGNGKPWWDLSCKLNPTTGCNTYAPTTLRIEKCNGVYLQDLHFKNSPQMHLIVYGSSDVYMKSLNISAPEESPNTDGIHIGSSHGVSVRSSIIGTGDDCISISDKTSNISVSDIQCGPGHGISIGSLGKDGEEVSVSNIHVKNVDFYGSTNGARIKTWQEGRGRVSQVFFSNLRFTAVKNPIIIDQYYCDARDACPKTETGVQISDVHYQMAFGTSSTKVAINLNCSNNVPCTNINLDTIKLESANEGEEPISSCNNAFGTTVGIVEPKSCLQ
ncbi:polygalacturonase-like [Syzygium oleosum]|uniref:polygalacturonase-like n=1 Tax=Syzygium oleosum TaxID=219896 RepID=UPI0024B9760F|nr:polygalacturonase-like [Syzygium oleosum]